VPAIGPIKRRELVAYLRALGFEPPVSGGDHQYMRGRGRKLRIPNPHTEDISRGLLVRILRQGGIDRKEPLADFLVTRFLIFHRQPTADALVHTLIGVRHGFE
jgi:predicted RNA binding protein YcfA (HicA-like mRNA interferase family)